MVNANRASVRGEPRSNLGGPPSGQGHGVKVREARQSVKVGGLREGLAN